MPVTQKYIITLTTKNKPLYNLPAESQMFFGANGRLYVAYDEDNDEDPDLLHDVTDQYIFKVEKI